MKGNGLLGDGMTSTDLDARSGARLTNLRGLFALSTAMCDLAEEEIFCLATASVPLTGSCWVQACYQVRGDQLIPYFPGGFLPPAALESEVRALAGRDGPVTAGRARWGWAFGLRAASEINGYLIVGASSQPTGEEFFLLSMMCRQMGAALRHTRLARHENERKRAAHQTSHKLDDTHARLAARLAFLEQCRGIDDALTAVCASGEGAHGIARVVHERTGLAVAVEDRFGNLRCSAGPAGSNGQAKPTGRRRDELLYRAVRKGHPVRCRDRLIAPAQPRDQVLGTLVLFDPDRIAGQQDLLALERGAAALALELAHAHDRAETELELRRDLVEDLLRGTEDGSAFARAEAVGHDLHGPHHLAVIDWRDRTMDEAMRAADRATTRLDMRCLLGRHEDLVIVLAAGQPGGEALYQALARELGTGNGAVGVSDPCQEPAELPHSLQEALRALQVRRKSRRPYGAATFRDLGIYRLLGRESVDGEAERFLDEWLGRLVEYDRRHHSSLVKTLSEYLECGGNYDAAAKSLVIHRSTLRYRLRRIREITNLDLRHVDNRLNLHVATRLWAVLDSAP